MRARMIFGVVVVGLVGIGCGKSNPIDRALTQAQVAEDVICECPEAVGVTTDAECRARVQANAWTPTEEECLRRVYAAHAEELRPVFDCQYEASVDFTNCVRSALATCPPTMAAATACNDALDAAFAACPRPSTTTEAELSACFPATTT
ncbi:MAG: hypothetical protein M3Y87_28755 [Myxococcota bacterium]|nr:hypothetical protein [Myxococcota bacterium]